MKTHVNHGHPNDVIEARHYAIDTNCPACKQPAGFMCKRDGELMPKTRVHVEREKASRED